MTDKEPKDLKELVRYYGKRVFIFAGMFSLFINLLMLTLPIYMLSLFDKVLSSFSVETLMYLTMIAIFALSIMALLDMVRSRLLIRLGLWADRNISQSAIMRGLEQSLQGGQYCKQFFGDISTVRQFLTGPAMNALFDAPWTPIYLLVIFLLNMWLGIIGIVGALILLTISILSERLTRAQIQASSKEQQQLQQQLNLAMANAETVQAMGMGSAVTNNWSGGHKRLINYQSNVSNRSSVLTSLAKFFRFVIQILTLGGGAYLVVLGQFTPGMMIACSILLGRALAPIEQAIGGWRQLVQARQAYERLDQYLLTAKPRETTSGLPEPEGLLAVKNVIYMPFGLTKPLLQGISFAINPGELLVVAGPSGAGKTTLLRLLVGVNQANRGDVRLDGVDVYSWDRNEFGQYVGYMPQQVELLIGTVSDNIARMQKDHNKEDVIAAAKAAGIHEMVLSLPNGYDTNLEDAGKSLPGGQRQRIALARALFGNPKLIILDEPSTYLDSEGQQALTGILKKLRQQKVTVVVVTHQMDLIQQSDKLLLLRQGMVYAYGPRQQVLDSLQAAKETEPKAINYGPQ